MSQSLNELLQPVSSEPAQKQKPVENAKTLYTFHSQQIDKLKCDKSNIEELKRDLTAKEKRLADVELEFTGPSLIQTATDIHMLTSCSKLEKEIADLKTKIAQIESGADVEDYFLRVGNILFSYSDAQERIAVGERPVELSKKSRVPANSVYSYFAPDTSDAISVDLKEKEKEHDKVKVLEKASDISNTIGFKRDKALETFLSALNPDSLHHDVAVADSIAEDYGNCPVCDTEMYLNETFLDCPGCGFRDMILIDSEKPSYKDPPREMSYYAYKKINHLNEWLAQFQAKETTEISQAVLDQIRQELRKDRITDMSKLKPSKLKEVIKKLKLNRCYDHIAHVLNRLNGISAPVLSREVEEKLRFMFKEIQFSFVKHCPKKRSNFLSYSFVLYKFCELLELDEYLPCFPLLKSREKLYMQDKIWQKICEDMGWEFIRTV
jgi:Zn finger protein HypA/HybF involved in hydrogenase expression